MKAYFYMFLILLGSLVAKAQNLKSPRTEFEVEIPNKQIKIQRGDSTIVTLNTLKSKSFDKKKTTLKIGSSYPQGVHIKISPDSGILSTSTISISVTKEAQTGLFSLIISAEMQNIKKGVITTFEII
jgi:hypothetical protein